MTTPQDARFMAEALKEQENATCLRGHVGLVIVRDDSILARAANGSPKGQQSCKEIGCLVVNNHCFRAIHAERKAIAQLALEGISPQGSTVYLTWFPCLDDMQLLATMKVSRIVYGSFEDPNRNYEEEFLVGKALAESAGIAIDVFSFVPQSAS